MGEAASSLSHKKLPGFFVTCFAYQLLYEIAFGKPLASWIFSISGTGRAKAVTTRMCNYLHGRRPRNWVPAVVDSCLMLIPLSPGAVFSLPTLPSDFLVSQGSESAILNGTSQYMEA